MSLKDANGMANSVYSTERKNIHVYILEQTPKSGYHVVGCNNIQCNFTSQHKCDVVKYVNHVNF